MTAPAANRALLRFRQQAEFYHLKRGTEPLDHGFDDLTEADFRDLEAVHNERTKQNDDH